MENSCSDLVERYAFREIQSRYVKKNLKFHLSLGLFSSAGIDTGTALLLRSLAPLCSAAQFNCFVDIGCGYGAIGLSLAAAHPDSHGLLVDRDALAVSFAAENSRLNHLTNLRCRSGLLDPSTIDDGVFDLIVSNLPAKAGTPALRHFLLQAPRALTDTGRVAIVVVKNLRPLVEESLASMAAIELLFEKHNAGHSVYHYRMSKDDEPVRDGPVQNELSPYIRNRGHFRMGRVDYQLDTVYGLGDFDAVGHRLQWAAELLADIVSGRSPAHERWLFFQPGQGHLPLYCLKQSGAPAQDISIVGRDLLQLKISSHNLRKSGFTDALELAHEVELPVLAKPGQKTLIVADLEPVKGSRWIEALRKVMQTMVGHTLLLGRATELNRLNEGGIAGCRLMAENGKHGYRCRLYRCSQ